MRSERNCPVCGTSPESAPVHFHESLNQKNVTANSFASRKSPEFMSHRMVRCPLCNLVYVPCPPRSDSLAVSYHQAEYDSAAEAEDAAKTYWKALRPYLSGKVETSAALEIGTGTAAFLDILVENGFKDVVGVEPSVAAIRAAPTHRKAWIREGFFEVGDYEKSSFDVVCCFMTLEHVLDPTYIAISAHHLLKPGGVFMVVVHDYEASLNRFLGRWSPIVDIEHMQLFSEKSLATLFSSTGYVNVYSEHFKNVYRIGYWWRLLPIPSLVKKSFDSLLRATKISEVRMGFSVGNRICVGYKPLLDV